VLAAYAFFAPNLRPWLRALLYAVAVGACLSSLTRTFIILVFAVPVMATMLRSPRRLLIGLYVGILAVMAADIVTDGAFSGFFWDLTEDKRLGGRAISYTAFLDFWTQYPANMLVGFGPGSAGSGLMTEFARANAVWNEPHNVFLKYLFELGIPLGVVSLWMLYAVSARAISQGGEERWFYLSLVLIVAIAGLTITSVEVWPINWYIGLILGMAMRRKASKTSAQQINSSTSSMQHLTSLTVHRTV
jgi:hypothetical protein